MFRGSHYAAIDIQGRLRVSSNVHKREPLDDGVVSNVEPLKESAYKCSGTYGSKSALTRKRKATRRDTQTSCTRGSAT